MSRFSFGRQPNVAFGMSLLLKRILWEPEAEAGKSSPKHGAFRLACLLCCRIALNLHSQRKPSKNCSKISTSTSKPQKSLDPSNLTKSHPTALPALPAPPFSPRQRLGVDDCDRNDPVRVVDWSLFSPGKEEARH